MYTIHLAKEPFKFSCSHFTILSANEAERLHGHNYQVRISIETDDIDIKLGLAFDFNKVKPLIRQFCDELDERILLPLNSPYLTVLTREEQIDVKFGPKNYSFPVADCLTLPLVNITSEELARYACERLMRVMEPLPFWRSLKVNIEETRGQSVSYWLKR